MMPLHHAERFSRLMHRIASSEWTLPAIGLLLPIIGIIAVLNQ